MLERARDDRQQECCGLLGGRDGMISRTFPAQNVARDPAKSYEISPKQLFPFMREIRAAGLQLLGIYHSHPAGPNEPSPRDIEQAFYPDAAYFILSPDPKAAKPVRAFSIRDGIVRELQVEVV
ncbi:MAG TPA: M67 family metallopeptidase [Candidatus Sulfotelmatobacter sp.]|nr:M67 family metallopeptidase [Candidatus Sulfotelmatobacter sp.]